MAKHMPVVFANLLFFFHFTPTCFTNSQYYSTIKTGLKDLRDRAIRAFLKIKADLGCSFNQDIPLGRESNQFKTYLWEENLINFPKVQIVN